jgi:hypothetical protein
MATKQEIYEEKVERPARVSSLKSVEQEYLYHNRAPALYLREGNDGLERGLKKRGWEKISREVVMTANDVIPSSTCPGTAKIINTDREFDVYVSTLERARKEKNKYINPYGPISSREKEYIPRKFQNYYHHNEVTPIIVYNSETHESEAVASLMTNKKIGLGYIEYVGAVNKRRGYGRTAIAACMEVSRTQDNKILCLTTEAGKGPAEAFGRMGWETICTVGIWTKGQVALTA